MTADEIEYPRRLEPWQRAHLDDAARRVNPEYPAEFWRGWHEQAEAALAATGDVVHCSVCDGWHEGCRFAAGSLYCNRPGCLNPHHRRKTVDSDRVTL